MGAARRQAIKSLQFTDAQFVGEFRVHLEPV